MIQVIRILVLLLCLGWVLPSQGQDELEPYEIALQRVEEARVSGATTLDLSSLGLTELPPEVGNLNNLRVLNLRSNQLSYLPPEMANLTELDALFLDENLLSHLPPWIGEFSNLSRADISANQLTTLPAEIGNLTQLHTLYLNFNQLENLPAEIGNLTQLETLSLYRNRLRSLPPQMAYLSNLRNLHVNQNRLQSPPLSVRDKGIDAMRDYWRDELNRQSLAELKRLIMLTVSTVGFLALVILVLRLHYPQQSIDKKKRDNFHPTDLSSKHD